MIVQNKMWKFLLLGCLTLWASARRAGAQSVAVPGSDANPGRPTVSTPATLTPVGYFQFETGILNANHSGEFSSRIGLNEVIKFSVASRLELIASAEPAVHSTSEGVTSNGIADTFLGAQAVLKPGHGANPTISASYFHRAYGGSPPELDIGSTLNSVILLASADVKSFHYDTNVMVNELGQGSSRRAQFGQTLCISHPISEKISLSGEIWHFTQPFLNGNAVGNLWAVSYATRKNLVFDAGFNRGLTGTSTRWEVFVGFTYLLPYRFLGR
jgi:hypothetical protein